MSSRPLENNPWPTQTPPPISPPPKRSLKRRRIHDESLYLSHAGTSKSARQVVADQDEIAQAMTKCQLESGNEVISCFPIANTSVAQHEWTSFVWNSRRPEITQTNRVDIFLFHGDSRQQILHFPNQINPFGQAGRINAQVNDSWWGSRGENWNGQNISYPFFWVLISSDATLDGRELAQPTFSAVQTTFADSVIASRSSSASAASAASLSSRSLQTLQSSSTPTTTIGSGSVQAASSNAEFPHWAIAVIVILGFLAIAASCLLAFLIIRRIRRRNRGLNSNRNSMGSASPMMANAGGPSSPLLGGTGAVGRHPSSVGHGGAGAADRDGRGQNAPSIVSPDGASTISRSGSAGDSAAPFSGADAAIMADAFRKMLRKPDFAGRPVEEGESPDGPENPEGNEDLINRELAEEGRDIRSVSSERGVKVETLRNSGDTLQDKRGGQ